MIDGKQVSTPISGKMSLPYSAAVAILRGKVGLGEFKTKVLNDREVQGLDGEDRCLITDPELDKLVPDHRGARAEILSSRTARKLTSRILDPKGEPENPGSGNRYLR